MYNFVNCLQLDIRCEKVKRPAPVGGALVFIIIMYYVETRADNSGYTNHRVTCLVQVVVMGSPFDSEQVC
jgi:hypothetical protein